MCSDLELELDPAEAGEVEAHFFLRLDLHFSKMYLLRWVSCPERDLTRTVHRILMVSILGDFNTAAADAELVTCDGLRRDLRLIDDGDKAVMATH